VHLVSSWFVSFALVCSAASGRVRSSGRHATGMCLRRSPYFICGDLRSAHVAFASFSCVVRAFARRFASTARVFPTGSRTSALRSGEICITRKYGRRVRRPSSRIVHSTRLACLSETVRASSAFEIKLSLTARPRFVRSAQKKTGTLNWKSTAQSIVSHVLVGRYAGSLPARCCDACWFYLHSRLRASRFDSFVHYA
jgi:hypothetical protein